LAQLRTIPAEATNPMEWGMENDKSEGSVEFEGKEMFVVRNGIRVAKRSRKDKEWVSLMPGVRVRDFHNKGRQGIEIMYSGIKR
jgi:hypothetical protein